MSRRGNRWDNAVAGSFFSSMKKERIRKRIYKTRDLARADTFDYIEVFYNRTDATVTSTASVRSPSNRPHRENRLVYRGGVSPSMAQKYLNYPCRFTTAMQGELPRFSSCSTTVIKHKSALSSFRHRKQTIVQSVTLDLDTG